MPGTADKTESTGTKSALHHKLSPAKPTHNELPEAAAKSAGVPVLFRMPKVESPTDWLDSPNRASESTPSPNSPAPSFQASPVVNAPDHDKSKAAAGAESLPSQAHIAPAPHPTPATAKAPERSWWEHWSSGVVLFLLLLALITAGIVAMQDKPHQDPSRTIADENDLLTDQTNAAEKDILESQQSPQPTIVASQPAAENNALTSSSPGTATASSSANSQDTHSSQSIDLDSEKWWLGAENTPSSSAPSSVTLMPPSSPIESGSDISSAANQNVVGNSSGEPAARVAQAAPTTGSNPSAAPDKVPSTNTPDFELQPFDLQPSNFSPTTDSNSSAAGSSSSSSPEASRGPAIGDSSALENNAPAVAQSPLNLKNPEQNTADGPTTTDASSTNAAVPDSALATKIPNNESFDRPVSYAPKEPSAAASVVRETALADATTEQLLAIYRQQSQPTAGSQTVAGMTGGPNTAVPNNENTPLQGSAFEVPARAPSGTYENQSPKNGYANGYDSSSYVQNSQFLAGGSAITAPIGNNSQTTYNRYVTPTNNPNNMTDPAQQNSYPNNYGIPASPVGYAAPNTNPSYYSQPSPPTQPQAGQGNYPYGPAYSPAIPAQPYNNAASAFPTNQPSSVDYSSQNRMPVNPNADGFPANNYTPSPSSNYLPANAPQSPPPGPAVQGNPFPASPRGNPFANNPAYTPQANNWNLPNTNYPPNGVATPPYTGYGTP